MNLFIVLVSFLIFFQESLGVRVQCPDQQETCECPQGVDECEFTLRIEQRFSFVSYALDEDGTLTDHGTLHYMDNTGFHYRAKSGDEQCAFENVYREKDFRRKNCSMPITLDGVTYRSIITINGRLPGPTLVVHENQIIIVHVINKLSDAATSVHWHGLHQRKSVWMDGVGGITHPPIDPGSSFDYIFKANPPGTHWYHSHVGSQKGDGLFGALIICEEIPLDRILGERNYQHVIDLFGNHTIAITDWHREPETIHQVLSGVSIFLNSPVGEVPASNMPARSYDSIDGASQGPFPFWSALINGRGQRTHVTPYSIFHVGRGNLYHFRLIGSANVFAFNFSIDGHRLQAIGSDGYYFKPVHVDYIIIHSGETYDFLLDTSFDSTDHDYWIRAETLQHNISEEHSARAILTYRDPNDIDWRIIDSRISDTPRRCSSNDPCEVLNCPFSDHPNNNFHCVALVSLESRPSSRILESEMLPKYPPDVSCRDCEHFLNFAFVGKRNTVNGIRFLTPPLSYATNCNQYNKDMDDPEINICNSCSNTSVMYSSTEKVCECVNVVQIASTDKFNQNSEPQSVAFVLSARKSSFSHPIHLHGHSFHIVHMGNASIDIECNEDSSEVCFNPRWKDGVRPQAILDRAPNGRVVHTAIQKDTVVVPRDSYVVISFQADNPGYWFMHCHVEEHLLDGMAVLIQEYSDDQHPKPPASINNHGSFKWTVEEYNKTIETGKTCSSEKSVAAEFLVMLVAMIALSTFIPLIE